MKVHGYEIRDETELKEATDFWQKYPKFAKNSRPPRRVILVAIELGDGQTVEEVLTAWLFEKLEITPSLPKAHQVRIDIGEYPHHEVKDFPIRRKVKNNDEMRSPARLLTWAIQ